jgi:hypothetical protein
MTQKFDDVDVDTLSFLPVKKTGSIARQQIFRRGALNASGPCFKHSVQHHALFECVAGLSHIVDRQRPRTRRE